MKVLECNQPTFFDVDDTLVKWDRAQYSDIDKLHAVAITCPTSRQSKIIEQETGEEAKLENAKGTWTEYLIPHRKHIEQLKLHKLRGHTIIVWSAGGWEWAEAVVRALKLEQYVDLVIEKPMWYYDDLTANEFMGKRIYCKDEFVEKVITPTPALGTEE